MNRSLNICRITYEDECYRPDIRPIPKSRKKRTSRRRRRAAKIRFFFRLTSLLFMIAMILYVSDFIFFPSTVHFSELLKGKNPGVESSAASPDWLTEMVERNPETSSFVENYENRASYLGKAIDLSKDYQSGQVPALYQWDLRWGYENYGNECIGVAGCGPTCLSMAYIYLTGDSSGNPVEMADYARDNGYYTSEGTSWSLWTEGVRSLGLSGTEISFAETMMKNALDQGKVIICSMGPGDFTTTGHIILIHGYDDNGFLINDPNRRSNTEKAWSFDTLYGQVRCLWTLEKAR